jgi:hypothetical protein
MVYTQEGYYLPIVYVHGLARNSDRKNILYTYDNLGNISTMFPLSKEWQARVEEGIAVAEMHSSNVPFQVGAC